MRRTGVLLAAGVALAWLLLTGCRARPEVAPGAPPPTPVARVNVEGRVENRDEAAADLAARFPLPVPEEEGEEAAPDDSYCIDCHTDEEAVTKLAKEPEKEEKLSEGEG
jgi:hypothetical protein